jgi:hypothetical protein
MSLIELALLDGRRPLPLGDVIGLTVTLTLTLTHWLGMSFCIALRNQLWRRRLHVSPKRLLTFNGLHSVTSQKIEIFIMTSNRTQYRSFSRQKCITCKSNWYQYAFFWTHTRFYVFGKVKMHIVAYSVVELNKSARWVPMSEKYTLCLKWGTGAPRSYKRSYPSTRLHGVTVRTPQ